MKGINTLTMNQATIEEAIQSYLEEEWQRRDFKVTGVDPKGNSVYGHTINYDVTYEMNEDKEEPKQC